jgi:antitoxin (DNA-binding transcriptional repressor) of toxin-antitoxin stability system
MSDTVHIHEAKTMLSKLVKRASQGETILIGAYGKPEAALGPVPKRKPRNLGAWESRKKRQIDYAALESLDKEIAKEFERSIKDI